MMEKIKLANGKFVEARVRKSIVLDGQRYYTDKDGIIVGAESESELINYLQAKGSHKSEWENIADGQYQSLCSIHQILMDLEEYFEDNARMNRKKVLEFVKEMRQEVNNII